MRKSRSPRVNLVLAGWLLAASVAQGQLPTPTPQTSSPSTQTQSSTQDETSDEVVRISSNLVQVDAVVTDKDGKLVTDLRADEIEIFEDGRPQKITNFSFVPITPPDATELARAPATTSGKTQPPPPPTRLRPEQVRRTIALVADDICASFESMVYIRKALKKYVDEQMQPTDMVSIMRTVGGTSALQNFTSNKQQLYAAIERVRWSPLSSRCVNSLAPLEGGNNTSGGAQSPNNSGDPSENRTGEEARTFNEQIFSIGTLGSLNYLIRGMREMPGRKAVILFSDGIEISPDNYRMVEGINRLTDLANRASVVVYTIDPRGLQSLALTAADNTAGMTPNQVASALADRRRGFAESQEGLISLAERTGGFAIRNSNDISDGLRRVLEDQRGYYLIAYRPDEKTFDPVTGRRNFHKLTAKLKRPGLRVRLRSGFYGITEELAHTVPHTRGEQLINALNTPFSAGGVRLRLTTLFGDDQKQGLFMRSMLHIDARDLTFVQQPDGWQKAMIDVLGVTFVENGNLVDQVNTTHTMRTRGKTYDYILKNGLVFNLNVPVKKPGAYQLRIAVRDTASERVGSASQFIEVPNLSKDRLALSGIVVMSSASNQATQTAADAAAPANDMQTESDPQAGPAVRRFRRGAFMDYYYYVYNAKLDKQSGRPQLQAQIRLFRDGQPVFNGQPASLDASKEPDLKRILSGGRMRLGTELTPGEYLLQVIVTDTLAKAKQQTTTQWIDFEIVE